MTKIEEESLGPPDIKIAGLQIWIHGYQYAKADNEDDANWLRATAHCGASGASVWVSGAILTGYDIEGLASGTDDLYNGKTSKFEVEPIEPELQLTMTMTDLRGHIELTVKITPDHLSQQHSFHFEIDQSYLPPIATQCRKILDRFPYRQR